MVVDHRLVRVDAKLAEVVPVVGRVHEVRALPLARGGEVAVQRAHDEAKARIDSKRKAKRISAMLNFIDEYSDETSLRSTLTECKLFGSH